MNKNLEAFLVFLKIGVITFGGGYAMISNIQEEIVEKRKWITSDELLDLLAVAESTPGPIAINMATYVGYKRNKFLGGLMATLGVVLPSFLIILGITYIFNAFITNQYVAYAFVGVKAAITFLIIRSGIKLTLKYKLKLAQKLLFIVALLACTAIEIFSINFSTIFVLLIAAGIGLFSSLIFKAKKEVK